MGLSVYNIKKWFKMLSGKSIMHVNQDLGKCFVIGEIRGYFNDLTEKVTKQPELIEKGELPVTTDEKAGTVIFPIAIFQYGLGAYDLFLLTNEERYLTQFKKSVDWAVNNQKDFGAWDNFGFIYPKAPYSSMCQGEGASLLVRAYEQYNDVIYLKAAKKAIDFMLIPKKNGGTAEYISNDLILYEYTNKPYVLNGWIFSIFGIYDLSIKDNSYKEILDQALDSLERNICLFDNGYWSMYDSGGKITSPFYHNLHIAQLEAIIMIHPSEKISLCNNKFKEYALKFWNRKKAFINKAIQKIFEKDE